MAIDDGYGDAAKEGKRLMKNAESWQTKPTDRFVLKWIKLHLSARITPRLVSRQWLRPWMITSSSALLGMAAGAVFALGFPFLAGCVAACAQVLDGVDGQFARLMGIQSRGGAFWDSVLDRYADGAMVMGMGIYLYLLPAPVPVWVLLSCWVLAVIGSNLISYSSARGETLGIDLGPPTLASKGTRSSIMIVSAWLAAVWPAAPLIALVYLVLHTNLAVIWRLRMALGYSDAP